MEGKKKKRNFIGIPYTYSIYGRWGGVMSFAFASITTIKGATRLAGV